MWFIVIQRFLEIEKEPNFRETSGSHQMYELQWQVLCLFGLAELFGLISYTGIQHFFQFSGLRVKYRLQESMKKADI